MGLTFYVYLPKFYADSVGIPLGTLGVIILLSRAWDALLDPTIGVFSDQTQSRWGRRAPWMIAGLFPLIGVFWLLCNPTVFAELVSPATRFGMLSFLFFLFWTSIVIPYEALGAELSPHHHERTSLFGFRESAFIVGTLATSLIPIVVFGNQGSLTSGELSAMGVWYGILTVLAVLLCAGQVKERFAHRASPISFKALRAVSGNEPFMVLLVAYTVADIGSALPATLILFYVEHVLGSTSGSLFLALYFGLGLLFLPAWYFISQRTGKKIAYQLALGINTGAFFFVFFLGQGDSLWYGVLVALSSIGFGGTLVLPSSMQADVIEYEEKKSGERREGLFVGVWAVFKKLAQAIGAAVAFPILGFFGYTAGAPLSDSAVLALSVLYAGVPSVCNFISLAIIHGYRVEETAETTLARSAPRSS